MIIYKGPSEIDGAPILGVLTGYLDPSSNRKTGRLAQLWIIRQDAQHGHTLRDGRDRAVCGGCPLAGGQGCYVNTQVTAAIWKARDRYDQPATGVVINRIHSAMNAGVIRGIRLGSYGDPVALPLEVVRDIIPARGIVTGYTHSWKAGYRKPGQPEPDPEWRKILMASCHGEADMEEAEAAGWRPFGFFPDESSMQMALQGGRRVICPANLTGAMHRSCDQCGRCNGHDPERPRVGIVELAHGGAAAMNALRRTQRRLGIPGW